MSDLETRLAKALELAGETLRSVSSCEEPAPDVVKFEQPKGKLPALKVPDPDFIVQRLKDGKSAGLLSRKRRIARLGEPQVLVNEIGVVEGNELPFAWAVVSQGGPIASGDIADVDPSLLDGIDAFTKKEFAAEKNFFYLPLALLVLFDPPIELKKPPAGRRFGSEVNFETDVTKAKLDALAFIASPDPEEIRDLADDELLGLLKELRGIYEKEFAHTGATRARGFTREDLVNAYMFVGEELRSRDKLPPDFKVLDLTKADADCFAKINPSGERRHADDPIRLDEVLQHFEKPMALRMPAVFLVGGVCNNGVSDNDIDVLIRGPIDDDTLHTIKFRLGRALPPRISKRVSFLNGETGPFTSHVPLYDLVLVPHEKRDLIAMSAEPVISQDDPLLDWPEKPGRRPFVVQFHFRGASLHCDLRIQVKDYLIGWTLALQRAGTVPDVNTVEAGRKIARLFDVEGSEFTKPFILPDRIFAAPKARQPVEWLAIDGRVFPPGKVGATSEEDGVIVAVLRETGAEWGLQKPQSHEYFFTGDDRFAGILFFRALVGERGQPEGLENLTPEGEVFWTCGFTKLLLPGVLNARAVETKSMPPIGQTGMPETLAEVTPKEFRFWEADTEKDALETRDALVRAKVFRDSNIILTDAEFRLATTKRMFLPFDPSDDDSVLEKQATKVAFTLTWQSFKGQTVIRSVPSRQVWHLIIADTDDVGVTDYELQRDPLSGEEAIMAVAQRGDKELLAFEGDVPPGKSIGGRVLNATKATPSEMRIQDKGHAELFDDQQTFKKIRFVGGKLKGIFTLVQEESDSAIWQLIPGSDPARSIPEKKVTSVDHQFTEEEARARAHQELGELEVLKQERTREDGTQIWDPNEVESGDDNGNDRARLRPPAIFSHMKPANRKMNVFTDPDLAADKFLDGQDELIEAGVQVEPKYNGFNAIVERWDAKVADDVPDGGVLIFAEDTKQDRAPTLQGFVKDIESIEGNFILDGEIMGVDESEEFIPRRDLAAFRGDGLVDDSSLRYLVYDAVYLPRDGNLTQATTAERRRALERFFREHIKSQRFILSPKKIVRSREQLRAAIDWASEQKGSEGAMLKQVQATYSLGGENDLFGKVKTVREVRAVVVEIHDVKDSPGVFNFTCAVGPISKADVELWDEVVLVGDQPFVVIGTTGNRKLPAKLGDVLLVQTFELLLEKGPPEKISWFGPAQALEVVDGPANTLEEIKALLRSGETKSLNSNDNLAARLSKAGHSIRILKADTSADTGGLKDERFVFGVVLVPDDTDSQGEVYTALEVEKAAYAFMEFYGNTFKLMHKGQPIEGVRILESYLTKVPETHGGEELPIGTWLMAVRVQANELWEAIKAGTFTGFSIGGTAIKERLQ